MIWNPHYESMEREKLVKIQSERLCELVDRIYRKVPFYRKRMDEKGVKPRDIEHISDITKLPFLTKDDMRDVYPFKLLAVDPIDIVEVHTSSGTTGKPVVDAYTRQDIAIWSEAMARTLAMGNTSRTDSVHNAYGYGLFTGGLGVHYGARLIGANVIPISGGNTARQLAILQDFKSTVLTCTPSYSLYLAEAAREQGLDFKKMSVRVGLFGAEPWSEGMRKEIESKLHIKALDIYGLTEIIGPGVSSECEYQDGLHICEDLFFPEIINPQTGEVLPDGEKGELVITTLTKQGTPVLRYRTRDITYLNHESCRCGRTAVRMHRLLGRTDDMLIIRGVNVFPSQIEEVLLRVEGIEPHYQLVIDRREQLDNLEVLVEMNEKLFSDEIKNLERFEQEISEGLYAALGIHARVKLVEPKSIPRSEGKAKRVVDKRQL
jgi:phenylacetate-CoA ligase